MSSKEFLDIQATICRFSLKRVADMIRTYSQTGYSRYIYQNELNKACIHHDMAYEDFKDLPRRIASEKVLNKLLVVVTLKEY